MQAMSKSALFLGVLLIAFACNASAETIQGEVVSVNPNQRTIQVHPQNALLEQDSVTIRVRENAALQGINDLQDLDAGDNITMEVESGILGQRNATRVAVQDTAEQIREGAERTAKNVK